MDVSATAHGVDPSQEHVYTKVSGVEALQVVFMLMVDGRNLR